MDMEKLWLEYAEKHAVLEQRVATMHTETRWGRNGISFLPLELERTGIPADNLDSLGRKELRTGVRVDLAGDQVVRQSADGIVMYYERNALTATELLYAVRNGDWLLKGIKVLATSDDGVPLWGRAMGRPREATTTYVEEEYFLDNERISTIRRQLTQIDRGRELRSSIDFAVSYGADGILAEITGVSGRTPPMKDVRERVYPRSR